MRPSRLTRTCLWETVKLTLFFGGGYMALVAVALVAPLVDKGAHLGDVLLFLPNQLAFPATIVLPMAFATALLAGLGRMQEDGELIALRAAGISSWRCVRATLPLALLGCLLAAWLAHTALPRAYLAFNEAKASLVRQGIATRVARDEPIIDHHRRALAALGAEGQSLHHVFGWSRDDDGNVIAAYAPHAEWVAELDPASGEHVLQLALADSRWLVLDGDNDFDSGRSELPNMAAMRFPDLVINVTQDARDFDHKPDGKSTAALHGALPRLTAVLAGLRAAADREAILPLLLGQLPDRIEPGAIRSWRPLVKELQDPAAPDDPALRLAPLLPDELVEAIAAAGRVADPAAVRAALERSLPSVATRTASLPEATPAALGSWLRRDDLPDGLRPRIGFLLLRLRYPALFATDDLDHLVLGIGHLLGRWSDRSDARILAEAEQKTQRSLRGHQMAWHLRWMLSVCLLAYWLFGAGLGLQLASRNRMLAAAIGLLVVVVTVLPGVGVVKGMRGRLDLNPAWIIWSPQLLLLGLGAWLCWRQR